MPFNIIRIPGQDNIVSDQTDDVLDIVAGPGIAITTNASIDTITITATGGGGGGSGYTGSVGPAGTPGDLGYTGSVGGSGYTGSKGDTGTQGYTGSEGGIGYTGSKGNPGGLGDIGYSGSTGDTGFTGSQGQFGFTGSVGFTGSQGDTGFTGSQGDTGLGFTIAKSYSSVAALQADVTPTGIVSGQFAIVETGNVTDPENSRLYLWNGTVYSYVSDLSGNIGITGPQGDSGYTGSIGSTGFTGSASTVIGFTGSLGITGNVGYTGSAAFNYSQDTGEPTGFLDRTDSTIAFNTATREFSIAPVSGSYDIYTVGVKRTISTTNTVTIPNVTGLYYIYFDSAGVLQYKSTFFDWPVDCMVAYVYWNATEGSAPFVSDERHGITMDWATHEYLHRTRGAAIASGFEVSNYTITGTGNANMDAQLDIANGTFFDEDLEVFISHSLTPAVNEFQQHLQGAARIPMMYLNIADWVMDAPTTFPLKQGTNRPRFNEFAGASWTTTDIDSNKYGITYIIATNNITYPVIGIIGQTSYNTIGTAQDATFDSLDLTGFPVVEFRPLYKVIYEVKNTYTNSVRAKFVAVQDLRSISAVSAISVNPSGAGYTGSTGYTGSVGEIGFTGSVGAVGFTGSTGSNGFTGSAGEIGFTGSGSTGFTGSQGSLGYTGSAGSGSGYGDSNVVTLLANFGSNTITTTGNITAKTAGVDIGYKSIPQVSWAGNATLALSDSGKHYYTTSATVITVTIPSNANVAFTIGDTINFINQSNNTMQINLQAGVTMYHAGNNTSSARSLAGFGIATVTKVATDTWFIAGVGVY